MTSSRTPSQVTQTTIAGFPILEKIGEGGMGTVYKAQNLLAGTLVAVKVLTGAVAANEVLRMRFAQECQIACKLNHPNIVRVLDFGLDGTVPYLVMEYVDGESLGQRLEREVRLPEAEAVRVIAQVGKALHWAHQRRLVHRDVKPDNILLDVSGQAKLTDLGLVKNLEGDFNLTQTQSSLGTPNFMAPEQFEDAKRADARSDLYSLAATLYMAVTGVLPFGGRSAKAVASIYKKKLANDITPPRQLVPELSEHLEGVILRGLSAARKGRYATVEEFVERLTEDPTAPAAPAPVAPAPASPPSPDVPAKLRGRKERGKKRYESRRNTTCKPLQRVLDNTWGGQVLNLSETGLCVELGRRYEPGAYLTIVVENEKSGRHTLVARVMWVKQFEPEKWRMGCQFDHPLCAFEVDALR